MTKIAGAVSRSELIRRIREHLNLDNWAYVEIKEFVTVPNSFMLYVDGKLHESLRVRYVTTHMQRWQLQRTN